MMHYRADVMWFTNREEWCAADVVSHLEEEAAVPLSVYPWLHDNMFAGRPAALVEMRRAPGFAEDFRAECERQGVVSMLGVPIWSRGRVVGGLGVDANRRERRWDRGEAAALEGVAGLLALARERDEAQARLEAAARARARVGEPACAESGLHLGPDGPAGPGGYVPVRRAGRPELLAWREIASIEAEGDYTKVCSLGGEIFWAHRSLRTWAAFLPARDFVVARRGLMVAVRAVERVEQAAGGEWRLRLAPDGRAVVISRRSRARLRDVFISSSASVKTG